MNYKKKLSELNLTVKFLANKLDVSQTMMSYYVNGTRPIPPEIESNMKRLLNAVGQIA